MKTAYQRIFLYPKSVITVEESLDYDKYWQEKRGDMYASVLSGSQKARADIIVQALAGEKYITIADIGCGAGVILKHIGEHISLKRSIGYDSSSYILEQAKKVGITDTVPLDINKEEDLKQIEPADYYLLLETLEHIPHSEKLLENAFGMAERGVFFSFPNSGYIVWRLRLLFGKFPAQWVNFPNEHLRFWTLRDLKWWLNALGYKNYEIFCYRGPRILNKLWPSLFAASLLVFLKKEK
ncbi:class I SAM-dependent methyltransferase [bacterium]|nr:class I SAM-dependent methyltransferase [bacterium]